MDIKDIRRKRLKDWFAGKALPEKEKSYLSQLITGRSTSFGERAARRLEKDYGMPIGHLDLPISGSEARNIHLAAKIKNFLIPVIGDVILGVDGSIEMVELGTGWLRIYSADKDAYGLKVKGDSMFPRIKSGEYVVVEPNTRIQSGDEVFVRTREGHNMIKVITNNRDGSYQFSSINNEHKPMTLDPIDVDKIHYLSAIVKATRYMNMDEAPMDELDGFNLPS
ncbi:TPA: helix-turn-helix transcriptional regulator [Yersinia enterocolitica]|nr:helix-turn-helix transcriptional regulator [Yersinia enterocolitica]